MRTTADERLGPFLAPGFPIFDEDGAPEALLPQDVERLPDLDDPATLGCLLALVRKAWGDAFHAIAFNKDGSVVLFTTPVSFIVSDEYPHLVAALEAAP